MTTLPTNIQRMHLEVSSDLIFLNATLTTTTFTDFTSNFKSRDQESFHSELVSKQVVSKLKLRHFHEANRGFGSYRSILYIDVRIEEP